MPSVWALPVCLMVLALLPGCMERVDAVLPPTSSAGEFAVPQWEYLGSFGGTAAPSNAAIDPWEQRFEEGKFLQLAGIDAGEDEIWACDRGLSRIQVFDSRGNFLRALGAGMPLAGTLPSDTEMYREEQEFTPDTVKWEDTPAGQRWIADPHAYFKGVDVALSAGGYWLADQMQSSGFGQKHRRMACRFYAPDGTTQVMQLDGGPLWPSYIAAEGDTVATVEQYGNRLCAAKLNAQGIWEIKRPVDGTDIATDYRPVMEVRSKQTKNPNYQFLFRLATGAGTGQSQFDAIAGLTFYNGKLLVCDPGNRRIQVFEGRPSMGPDWVRSIKIVTDMKYSGELRFTAPTAVDCSPEGYVYVLDGTRRDVAVLSPTFERLATLSAARLEAPFDLSVSPSGRMLYISDSGHNLIHRYALR